MTIALDREKRLILLKWLKYGIDTDELDKLYNDSISAMTSEDLNAELERLYKADVDYETCNRLRKINKCRFAKEIRIFHEERQGVDGMVQDYRNA